MSDRQMIPETKCVPQRIGFFVGVVVGGSWAMADAPIVLSGVSGIIAGFAYFSITTQMSHDFRRKTLNFSSPLYWLLFLCSTGVAYASGFFFFGEIAKKHDSPIVPMLASSLMQGGVAGLASLVVFWLSNRIRQRRR